MRWAWDGVRQNRQQQSHLKFWRVQDSQKLDRLSRSGRILERFFHLMDNEQTSWNQHKRANPAKFLRAKHVAKSIVHDLPLYANIAIGFRGQSRDANVLIEFS